MTGKLFVMAVLGSVGAIGLVGCQSGPSAGSAGWATVAEAAGAFDRIKGLAGEWQGKGSHGSAQMDVTATYAVTSGGSAVVETLFPGTPGEMVTIYTLDRGSVVMTHYCSLANQPHLRLASVRGDDYSFEFVTGGNMASRDEMHMDSMVMTFEGSDGLKTDWTSWEGGKAVGHALFDLRRVGEARAAR